MKFTAQRLYIYAALLSITSWFLLKLFDVEETKRTELALHRSDFYSNGYAKVEMDEEGQVKNKLIADKIIHYSDDRNTELLHPVYYSYSASSKPSQSAPWIISAETGRLAADGNDLQLNGNAVIQRAEATNVKPIIIKSANLNVQLKTGQAQSSEWSELSSSAHRTTGRGMKLTYKQPIRIELLHSVKGTYETK